MTLLSIPQIFILAFSLLIGFAGVAQIDSEVYRYNDSLETKINEYRTNVFRQLKSGQGEAVQLNYGFETLSSTPYAKSFKENPGLTMVNHYLSLNEIEGIYLIQHNFEGVLEIVRNNDFVLYHRMREELSDPRVSTNSGSPYREMNWYDDSLCRGIGTFLLTEVEAIKSAVQEANHPAETKAFLNVFLDYEVAYLYNSTRWDLKKKKDRDACFAVYETLDSLAHLTAEKFIAQYPNSEFNGFIMEFILYENTVRDWGFGIDQLYLGTIIPTKELSEIIKPAYLYVNLGFRVYYKNAFLNLMGGVGGLGLRDEIFHDTLWTNVIGMYTGDLTLGYCFDITRKFNITPLIGVRGIATAGPNFNGKTSWFAAQNPFVFGLEFNYGGISDAHNYVSPNYGNGRERKAIGLKIMYQNPSFEKTVPGLEGGLLTVTLGVNLAFFGEKFWDANPTED